MIPQKEIKTTILIDKKGGKPRGHVGFLRKLFNGQLVISPLYYFGRSLGNGNVPVVFTPRIQSRKSKNETTK